MGKTRGALKSDIRPEKHPHARGEDREAGMDVVKKAETPPRTWGRLIEEIDYDVKTRNTPTHVGKTNSLFFFLYRFQKHPHARGED